jgi:branched-chain amino acid transport system permease protein
MNANLIWIGILQGSYSVPVALAFALVLRHGRYLPLWLPECGMLAAYIAYALTSRTGLQFPLAVLLACALGTGIALLIHFGLFGIYTVRPEAFKALLRSIGVMVVLENLVSLLSGGYSLAFPPVDGLDGAGEIGRQDRLVLISVAVLTTIVWFIVNRTRIGLAYKASSSNRSLACRYGLPVRKVDLTVILAGGAMCSIGGVINGVRYGLTADMMMTNALEVVAVVVAVGTERLGLTAIGMLAIGVMQSLCQASPRLSAFAHGIPFAVLAIALLLRYGFEPLLRRLQISTPIPVIKQTPETLR